jgi:hypothetical protein
MNEATPRIPTGTDNKAIFDQALHRSNFAGQGQLRSSSTVKVRKTSSGIIFEAASPTAPGSRPFLCRVTSLVADTGENATGPDYVMCKRWNPYANAGAGAVIGSEFYVAKGFASRMPASEMKLGIKHTYIYKGDNERLATAVGLSDENEYVIPRYAVWDANNPDDYGNLIMVARSQNGTGATYTDPQGNKHLIYFFELCPTRQWGSPD